MALRFHYFIVLSSQLPSQRREPVGLAKGMLLEQIRTFITRPAGTVRVL